MPSPKIDQRCFVPRVPGEMVTHRRPGARADRPQRIDLEKSFRTKTMRKIKENRAEDNSSATHPALMPFIRTKSLAAAFFRLFESVEQAAGIGAGEGIKPMRLALFDRVACDRSL